MKLGVSAGAIGCLAVFTLAASGQVAGARNRPAAPSAAAWKLGPEVLLDAAGAEFTALSSSSAEAPANSHLDGNARVRAIVDSRGEQIISGDRMIIVSSGGAVGAIPLEAWRNSRVLPAVSAAEEMDAAKIADQQANAEWRQAHMIGLKKVEQDKLYIENRPAVRIGPGQRLAVYRIAWDFKTSQGFYIHYSALKVGELVVNDLKPEFISTTYKGLPITNADVGAWGYVYLVFVP
jgi:hypothetical protein